MPSDSLLDVVSLSEFDPIPGLRIIDEAEALDQCMDWSFVHELLTDILGERTRKMQELQQRLARNDHDGFRIVCHSLVGAARNMFLIGLADVTTKGRSLGQRLVSNPNHTGLLALRQTILQQIEIEYQRIEQILPQIQANAEAEADQEAEEAAQAEQEEEEEAEAERQQQTQGQDEPTIYEDENGNWVDENGVPVDPELLEGGTETNSYNQYAVAEANQLQPV